MPIEVSSQEGEFLEGIPWISNEYRNFDGLNPIIIPWNPIKSPFLLVKHKSQLFLRAKSTFSVGLLQWQGCEHEADDATQGSAHVACPVGTSAFFPWEKRGEYICEYIEFMGKDMGKVNESHWISNLPWEARTKSSGGSAWHGTLPWALEATSGRVEVGSCHGDGTQCLWQVCSSCSVCFYHLVLDGWRVSPEYPMKSTILTRLNMVKSPFFMKHPHVLTL